MCITPSPYQTSTARSNIPGRVFDEKRLREVVIQAGPDATACENEGRGTFVLNLKRRVTRIANLWISGRSVACFKVTVEQESEGWKMVGL